MSAGESEDVGPSTGLRVFFEVDRERFDVEEEAVYISSGLEPLVLPNPEQLGKV